MLVAQCGLGNTDPDFAVLKFESFESMLDGMDFVTIFTAFNPAQAHLMRSRLEASEFLVNVKNENAALAMDGYGMAVGGIQLQVPEDQAEDALELIRSIESPDAET